MRVREPARFVQKGRYRRSTDALGRLLKKLKKKKKMENSRVCRLLASGTIGVFYACL